MNPSGRPVKYKTPEEVFKAIGQLLDYGRYFTDSKKELVLLTTMFCPDTASTIKHYNLPIRYIYFDKKFSMEHLNDIG